MKVIINTCLGVFGLSEAAMRAIAKRKGLHYVHYEPYGTRMIGWFCTVPIDSWEEYVGNGPDAPPLTSDLDLDHHDPDLVAVVEELGERANGSHAELKVVEIPDGTEYEIDGYEGMEHVAETHRTWE